MTSSELEGLSFALCEATICGLEFDPAQRVLAVTLAILRLPPNGPEPDDLRLQFCFLDVARLAISKRLGHWSDQNAAVVPLDLSQVDELFASAATQVYGDKFFDVHEQELRVWGDRLSLDWKAAGGPACAHTFRLFQEGATQHVDLLVWFNGLRIFTPGYDEVSIEWIVAGSRRWWTAWNEDDPRTKGHGIIRLSSSSE